MLRNRLWQLTREFPCRKCLLHWLHRTDWIKSDQVNQGTAESNLKSFAKVWILLRTTWDLDGTNMKKSVPKEDSLVRAHSKKNSISQQTSHSFTRTDFVCIGVDFLADVLHGHVLFANNVWSHKKFTSTQQVSLELESYKIYNFHCWIVHTIVKYHNSMYS